MNTALEDIAARLDANEWKYRIHEEDNVIATGFTTRDAQFRLIIAVDDADGVVEFSSQFPTRVPEEKRLAVAEFCARANFFLRVGRLNLDFTDGEMRMHVAMPYDSGHLPCGAALQCIETCCHQTDLFHAPIMAIIYGNSSPKAAIEALEEDSDEEDTPKEHSA